MERVMPALTSSMKFCQEMNMINCRMGVRGWDQGVGLAHWVTKSGLIMLECAIDVAS